MVGLKKDVIPTIVGILLLSLTEYPYGAQVGPTIVGILLLSLTLILLLCTVNQPFTFQYQASVCA